MQNDGHSGNPAEARRLYGRIVHATDLIVQRQGGPQEFAEARRLLRLAAALGLSEQARETLVYKLDRAEAQRAKQQADADAMMEQLLAEDVEEKQAKGAAKSAKSAKGKTAKNKGGKPPAASPNAGIERTLEAGDTGVRTEVEDSDEAQQALLVPIVSSLAAGPSTASQPAAPEPVAPFTDAGAAAPVPVAIEAAVALDERPTLASNVGGRGGQGVQSATEIATGDAAAGAVAHLLSQASLQVSVGSSDVGAAAPVAAAAPMALDRPSPPPATVTSLADAQFSTGRPEPPESTIGGQSTCIVCFTNPKSHIAVPCGHQSACGACSAQMQECPVCRSPVREWMQVRVA